MSPPLIAMVPLEWTASSAASIVNVPSVTVRAISDFRALALSSLPTYAPLPPPVVMSKVPAAADGQFRLRLDAVLSGVNGDRAAGNGHDGRDAVDADGGDAVVGRDDVNRCGVDTDGRRLDAFIACRNVDVTTRDRHVRPAANGVVVGSQGEIARL